MERTVVCQREQLFVYDGFSLPGVEHGPDASGAQFLEKSPESTTGPRAAFTSSAPGRMRANIALSARWNVGSSPVRVSGCAV